MWFSDFSQQLEVLSQSRSRLTITAQLADLFRGLDKTEIKPALYFLQGQLLPVYDNLEFGISSKLVLRALTRCVSGSTIGVLKTAQNQVSENTLFDNLPGAVSNSSAEPTAIAILEKEFKRSGDLGLLAEKIVANKFSPAADVNAPDNQSNKFSPTADDNTHDNQSKENITSHQLSVNQVYLKLVELAKDSGEGSQERKIGSLANLYQQLNSVEAKFCTRIVLGKLRLGFSTMTIIDALSWYRWGDKRESAILEEAYQKKADAGLLAEAYLSADSSQSAADALKKYQVQAGVPLIPALCQRLNSAEEIISKMGRVIAEPKYDGLRVQIHFWHEIISGSNQPRIAAYTRNLELVTPMFPELQTLKQALTCQSCVLDSEAVGFDSSTQKTMSFQDTITRKRKHEVENQALQVPLKFFVFDVMEIDGETMIDKPLTERKKRLDQLIFQAGHHLPDQKFPLVQTQWIETADPLQLHAFHEAQLKAGLEGAVIKQIDSAYKSGRKGWRWVKIKEAEGTQGKMSDTIDCVVMGYYAGKGKRTSFGAGAFLLGVLGETDGVVVVKSLAKLGTGLTDAEFKQLRTQVDLDRVADQPAEYVVPTQLKPDVWVSPKVVVEIAADELTPSPLHAAGWSVRFPRLVRFRPDKRWDQATTIDELTSINQVIDTTPESKPEVV